MQSSTITLEAPPKKRILLVDDHPVVRHALTPLIELQPNLVFCGEAESATGAIRAVEDDLPDVAIIDTSMTGANGIELIKHLRAGFPELVILVLSMHDELLYAERASKAGARGYVMKREATEKLADAVEKITSGEAYISQRVNEMLIERLSTGTSDSQPDLVHSLSA